LADIEPIPAAPGIYTLGAPFTMCYPHKQSKIFYIGATMDHVKRLSELKAATKAGNQLLNLLLTKGLDVSYAWMPLPECRLEELMAITFNTIVMFGKDYGLIPYGNETLPDADPIGTTIRMKEDHVPEPCLSPEDIAEKFGLIYEVTPYPVVITGVAETSGSEAGSGEIFSGNFHVKP